MGFRSSCVGFILVAFLYSCSPRCVTYKNNDGRILKLSQLAKTRDRYIRVNGEIDYICKNIDFFGPVTFAKSDSYLKLSPWDNQRSNTIQLKFRTTEPHGLILFGSGQATEDFFALELYNGYLYLLINLGSGLSKIRSGINTELNEGKWHYLMMKRVDKQITLTVDDDETRFKVKGKSSELNLEGSLFLGGTDFVTLTKSARMPKGLWTASLRYGFVGCIGEVYMDTRGIDIQALARDQVNDPSVVAPECSNLGRSQCASNPCKNGGNCREGWNRFVCDCAATAFSGDTCEYAVNTVGFNGSQMLYIPMASTKRTQAEEISFRFMSPLSSGLLLTTASQTTTDRLTVQLDKGGRVKLTVDLDCAKTNCTTPRQGADSIYQGTGCNDNQWHTVRILRHGRRLSLEVDGKIRGSELPSGHNELQFDAIAMGMVPEIVPQRLRSKQWAFAPPFGGQMQNLMFNNELLIDRCFLRKIRCNYNNVTWGDSEIISNPVTFKDKESYVSVQTLDAYSSMTLFFHMRTTVSDGLILFNAGKFNDFIAVELVSGFIHYVYDLGNGAQIISTPDRRPINDNEWHSIRIVRDGSNKHTLTIDGSKVTHQGMDSRRNLDLEGPLYVGGVKQGMYYSGLPEEVASRTGFQGCLGTLDFNGFSPQLLGRDMVQSAGSVALGCAGPTTACTNTSCSNGGLCKQQWDSYTCDCSMTIYIGPTCEQHINTVLESTAYRFGEVEGMIVYRWPSSAFPSTREDFLAFGFATRERNCALTRISSTVGGNNPDYLQLEIENGKLTLRYNIGNEDVKLQEPMGVADGQLHTVQVRRKWMNATMRVDNWPERTRTPSETQRTVFNSQSMIQIGGLKMDDSNPGPMTSMGDDVFSKKTTRSMRILRPFKGQMMGFFFNGVKVFRLAAHGSEQVTIYGDVQRISEGSDSSITNTPPSGFSFPTTTMATTTTFSTSSTRASRATPKNTSLGDECAGEDMCTGATGNKQKEGKKITPKSTFDPVLPNPVLVPPPFSLLPNTSKAKPLSKLPPGDITEDASYNASNANNSANLTNGDKKIADATDDETEVRSSFFAGMLTGTTAMIAGIVGAAVLCIMAILVAMYKYKNRDGSSYSVDEKGRNMNGNATPVSNGKFDGKNGSIVRGKKNSTTVHGKSLSAKHTDKEYYV